MPYVIPRPSGPYYVGCSDIITDYGKERLLFRLFYPAKQSPDVKDAIWLTDSRYANGFTNFSGVPYLSWVFQCFYNSATMPAGLNAKPIVPEDVQKLPVVVFSHGVAGDKTSYSNICTELASYGMLVLAMEHGDQSAAATYYYERLPDGVGYTKKWIEYLVTAGRADADEIRADQLNRRVIECNEAVKHLEKINEGTFQGIDTVIDLSPYKDKVDLDKLALVGHSFGAATALTVLAAENRYKLVVAMDTWSKPIAEATYESLQEKPILFINCDTYHDKPSIERIYRLKNSSAIADRKLVTMLGTVHQFPTDFALLLRFQWLSKRFILRGTEDPWLVSKMNNRLTRAFVGKHLCLSFGSEVDDIVEENGTWVLAGTNVDLS